MGSLLRIRLSKTSFPVGKVEFLNLYPMTFSEFLIADDSLNLIQVMCQTTEIKEIPKIFELQLIEEFKGAFTENYVANALCYLLDESPNYYTFDRNEIDFVIQRQNRIIPIEVKSDKNTNHNSLTKYNANNDNKISFRFLLNNKYTTLFY